MCVICVYVYVCIYPLSSLGAANLSAKEHHECPGCVSEYCSLLKETRAFWRHD